MARAPSRRQRTGNRRRLPKRKMNRNRRNLALSHKQVGFEQVLHKQSIYQGGSAVISLLVLFRLIFVYAFIRNNSLNDNAEAVLLALSHLQLADFIRYIENFNRCQQIDFLLHDIPEDEENNVTDRPRQNICFNSWSDLDCYQYTCFTKAQLRRIFNCFNIAALADPITGNIRVPTGQLNNRGIPCCYVFNQEELFLYFMLRMKSGDDHTKICKDIFGGNANRWSYAWRFIIFYLDNRYENIIGHQGLVRFVDEFPDFYDAIQKKVQRRYISDNRDGTYNVTSGLSFLPFDIFGFIDCSIDRICKPFSGPAGDYEGCGRKEEYSRTQRAFYTGYKRIHGIKVETVLLPNGISTIFGPVSCRQHDVRGVLQMSRLNEFLVLLQQNRNHEYQALGDGIYSVNLRCIRSYFKSYAGQPPLTPQQQACNAAIKKCRESIEWSYGDVSNMFKICDHQKHNKLAKKVPYAIEQLRVAHLMTNIYTCLNGDKASGHNMFYCPSPRMEDYLRL
jgi:hypothetical protein